MARLPIKLLLGIYNNESGGETESSKSKKQMDLIRKGKISKAEKKHLGVVEKVTLSMDGYYYTATTWEPRY